jgi:predicted Holliday junction resolvase-like endonuclease
LLIQNNPHLQKRKSEIAAQINDIQSRADAVVEMGKQITKKIDEICAEAKKQSEAIIENKVNVFKLAHCAFRR